MNKTFYILGIVFSIVFFIVIAYYIDEVSSAAYSPEPFGNYGDSSDITGEAGIVSALFILFFIVVDILGLLKIKTRTTRTLGIVGLSLSGLFLVWAIVMLGSPGSIGFNEVGPGFWLYAMIMLAFSITGLIQSILVAKRKDRGGNSSNDLLDS